MDLPTKFEDECHLEISRLAKNAAPDKRVLVVARILEPGLREALESQGIETFTPDHLEETLVANIPKFANVIFKAGRKFGSQGAEELTSEHRWLEG